MEKDLLTIINENSEERYKLLSIIDNQYIIYTVLSNINPTSNIHIMKVESLDKLMPIPIDKKELEIVEKKYLELLK